MTQKEKTQIVVVKNEREAITTDPTSEIETDSQMESRLTAQRRG